MDSINIKNLLLDIKYFMHVFKKLKKYNIKIEKKLATGFFFSDNIDVRDWLR